MNQVIGTSFEFSFYKILLDWMLIVPNKHHISCLDSIKILRIATALTVFPAFPNPVKSIGLI